MMKSTKVSFVFPTNRNSLLKDVKEGYSPDNALYGYNHLSKKYSVVFYDAHSFAEKFLDFLFLPIHLLFISQIDIDFKISRILLQLSRLNKADVIVANTDGVALAACLFKKLKILKPPLIYAVGLFYIQGGLKEAIVNDKKTYFYRFYKWILSGADHIIYHAPIEKEKLERLGLYNPANCSFIPMGSDKIFFKSRKFSKVNESNNLVLSVGKDRARDYKTLLQAAKTLPDTRFVVVCRKENLKNLEIPTNVKVLLDIPYYKVAKLYMEATIIVIPIKEMSRSSGQMTLTDAIQAQKSIIITDVKGISHYPLINNMNVIKATPTKAEELGLAINKLLMSPNLRKKIIKNCQSLRDRFTTENYAKDLSCVIDIAMDNVKLISISANNLEFARKVRNQNRQYFIDSSYISKTDHQNWFENYLAAENDYMYILTANGTKIAIAAIYNIDYHKKTAEIGRFAINQKFKHKGFGKILIRKIEDIAFHRLGLMNLKLKVLANNKAALSLYGKMGFKRNQIIISNGKKLILMIKKNNILYNSEHGN